MRIVIGVDGSAQGLVAAELVATLPLAAEDEVIVVSVVAEQLPVGAWSYVHVTQTVELHLQAREAAEASAREAVGRAAASMAALPCHVRTVVAQGHPAATVPELVEQVAADLVVVGPHGAGRLEEMVLGSVTQSLLERMPASVLVAREPARPPARVLLAYDGSPHSRAAAEFVVSLPLPPDAEIQVLTVADVELVSPESGGVEGAEARGREIADEAVAVLGASGRPSAALIRPGRAKHTILAVAREERSDLIVLGARGLGGFRGLVLGSVSQAVSRAAPCSVLVVASPTSEERGSGESAGPT